MSSLLPDKYVNFADSIVGSSSMALSLIKIKKTSIDKIYSDINKLSHDKGLRKHYSLDDVVIILDFLYLLGLIEMDSKGNIIYAPSKTLF